MPPRATAILRQAGHAGTALLAVTAERAFLLHTPKAIGTSLFGSLSLRQQALDVVQLHKCLLEGVLKISEEAIRNQENVSYCREAAEALIAGAKWKGPGGVPDESGAHRAGSRYRFCRRSAAPEVHRFLPQVAERSNDLCAGLANCSTRYSATQFSVGKPALDTENSGSGRPAGGITLLSAGPRAALATKNIFPSTLPSRSTRSRFWTARATSMSACSNFWNRSAA